MEEMEEKKCVYCGKKLLIAPGKKRLNPRRNSCNRTCSTRYHARRRNNRLKDNEEYKLAARTRFKEWYAQNKDKQNKNILRYYYKHKSNWRRRQFIHGSKKNIYKFINPNCSCGKETKFIYHIGTSRLPKLHSHNKKNPEIIKEYTEKNLVGVCSLMCGKKLLKEKRGKEGR